MADYRNRGFRIFLLERGIETKGFSEIVELTEGFTFEYDGYRQLMVLEYATLDPDFDDQIARCSYIAAGVPDGDDQVDIYEIDPSRRDVVPPTTDDPSWKIFLLRIPHERYEIPPSAPEWVVQRVIGSTSLALVVGSNIVGVSGANFTGDDVGRRLTIEGVLEGIIQSINSSEEVELDTTPVLAPFFGYVTIYELA